MPELPRNNSEQVHPPVSERMASIVHPRQPQGALPYMGATVLRTVDLLSPLRCELPPVDQRSDVLTATFADFIQTSTRSYSDRQVAHMAWQSLTKEFYVRTKQETLPGFRPGKIAFPVRFLSHPPVYKVWHEGVVTDLDIYSLGDYLSLIMAELKAAGTSSSKQKAFMSGKMATGVGKQTVQYWRRFVESSLGKA